MKTRQRSRKGAPGIVDVAINAGVSPATVSRYYNSPEVVRTDTRKAIEKAALDLGYIRDRMAGSMHSRFSGTIGLVVPTINHAIFSELIEAFSNRLLVHDRTMLIASHNYDLSLEVSIIRSLLERRIDGIALVGQDHEDAAMEMLRVRDVPVITLWGHPKKSSIPFIGANNLAAGETITNHLLDLGHHDIAFLFPQTSNNDRARDRKQGALQTMLKRGIDVPAHRIIACPYNIAEAKQLALGLIDNNRPTAVVCGNDIIAHGVIYAAQQSGLQLPQDMSVAGIGDFSGSADITPGLTTVRLPANRIGQMAADSLVSMSKREPAPLINKTIDTQLMVRRSTCPPTHNQ